MMGYFIPVASDVDLFVEDLNPNSQRPAILFLHGWPLSHKQFEYQFLTLSQLGFRCIGVDWRGFGKSDKPANGYNLDQLADDLLAIINALQLKDFVLAGHSTGGAIAIHYMSRHHGFGVSKLVLISAAAPTSFSKEEAEQWIQQIHQDRAKMMRNVNDAFFFQYISQPLSDWFFQMGMEAASWSTAAIAKMLSEINLYEELSSILVPTLIMHGIHDKVVPFQQAEVVQQLIPSATLIPFKYSGHGVFYEEKELFNQQLISFISS